MVSNVLKSTPEKYIGYDWMKQLAMLIKVAILASD